MIWCPPEMFQLRLTCSNTWTCEHFTFKPWQKSIFSLLFTTSLFSPILFCRQRSTVNKKHIFHIALAFSQSRVNYIYLNHPTKSPDQTINSRTFFFHSKTWSETLQFPMVVSFPTVDHKAYSSSQRRGFRWPLKELAMLSGVFCRERPIP